MSPSCHHTLALPWDRTAPSAARRFVRELSCPSTAGAGMESAQLVVSELVSNAVSHALPPLSLQVRCSSPATMEFLVGDGSPEVGEVEGSAGHGLRLIEALSVVWGVGPHPLGKAVWARTSRLGLVSG